MDDSTTRRLRMGMIGGGRNAFIGAVHRMAARLDDSIEFVAGALSSTAELAMASGQDLHLAEDRIYSSWQAMLDGELARPANERIDFVTVVTPNASHFEICRAFVEAGFHVVVDKPMVTTVAHAEELVRLVAERETVFCVTYNYTGYLMIRQARDMIRAGEFGDLRKVIVEYHQGWLGKRIEQSGQKQAAWRTDPVQAGAGGAIGDIGCHAEHLASYVTDLRIDALSARLAAMVPGRPLDDDADVRIRYCDGATGVLLASQVCTGSRNDLRLRVWGSKAGLEWHQENPNRLHVRREGGDEHVLHAAQAGMTAGAASATRLPAGHPEGFISAFANIYRDAATAMRQDVAAERALDYPDVRAGAASVRFINAAVISSRSDGAWVCPADLT